LGIDMITKHKVFAYITYGERLLLFSHPFAPEAGIQVPAGTVETNEDWETAVLREATEETGLPGLQIVRHLGDAEHQWPGREEIALRHFYHLRCTEEPPERWWHGELYPSEGEAESIPFEFFWAQLPHEVPLLAPGHGQFLAKLMADLEINLLPVGPLVGPQIGGETAVWPQRVVVNGRIISLAPLDPGRDAAHLFAISHGDAAKEAIWTYMSYGPFAGEAAMQQWLKQQAHSSDPLFFTVLDNQSGQPAGLVSYLNIVPDHRRLEVGHIWYGLAYQRTRVNTEAIYLMLTQAFEQWGYRRVEWKCDALNGRSRRAALRLGFQYEGLFRQHLIVKGRNRDTTWFAMMDHEWPPIKANMEQWLYDEARWPLGWLHMSR
jgi:RimJ/RimL family protein N-acetyltransferase/8-oxo-dGTP pyrophosphatase MutT (NUDIX family)